MHAIEYNDSLCSIDLGENAIGVRGATILSRNLEHKTKLLGLDVSSNLIRDEGCRALLDAIQQVCVCKRERARGRVCLAVSVSVSVSLSLCLSVSVSVPLPLSRSVSITVTVWKLAFPLVFTLNSVSGAVRPANHSVVSAGSPLA